MAISEQAAQDAVTYLIETAQEAGVARAQVGYMAQWVKIVKARLMRESNQKSAAAQERDALCHPDYLAAVEAEREANSKFESLRFHREAQSAVLAAWQTESANHRGIKL